MPDLMIKPWDANYYFHLGAPTTKDTSYMIRLRSYASVVNKRRCQDLNPDGPGVQAHAPSTMSECQCQRINLTGALWGWQPQDCLTLDKGELFSQLVSLAASASVWPYLLFDSQRRTVDPEWTTSAFSLANSRVFHRGKRLQPHLSYKQFILNVTVLVLQYVNL